MAWTFPVAKSLCSCFGSLVDFFSSWRMAHFGRTLARLWNLCLHALIWAIWKEGNNRVFDNLIGDWSSVRDSFLFKLVSWARKDCNFFNFCLNHCVVI